MIDIDESKITQELIDDGMECARDWVDDSWRSGYPSTWCNRCFAVVGSLGSNCQFREKYEFIQKLKK